MVVGEFWIPTSETNAYVDLTPGDYIFIVKAIYT
jgi:hypothetical protein